MVNRQFSSAGFQGHHQDQEIGWLSLKCIISSYRPTRPTSECHVTTCQSLIAIDPSSAQPGATFQTVLAIQARSLKQKKGYHYYRVRRYGWGTVYFPSERAAIFRLYSLHTHVRACAAHSDIHMHARTHTHTLHTLTVTHTHMHAQTHTQHTQHIHDKAHSHAHTHTRGGGREGVCRKLILTGRRKETSCRNWPVQSCVQFFISSPWRVRTTPGYIWLISGSRVKRQTQTYQGAIHEESMLSKETGTLRCRFIPPPWRLLSQFFLFDFLSLDLRLEIPKTTMSSKNGLK